MLVLSWFDIKRYLAHFKPSIYEILYHVLADFKLGGDIS